MQRIICVEAGESLEDHSKQAKSGRGWGCHGSHGEEEKGWMLKILHCGANKMCLQRRCGMRNEVAMTSRVWPRQLVGRCCHFSETMKTWEEQVEGMKDLELALLSGT